ncbi:MAG TPA: hypothetical protein ENK06_03820, partial [Gammaproteobacteria bacterium]|nr:hypothetical protein [Gammaproteobacteria bacterium]
MKTKIINQIIKAGIAAPSADNSQPWQYSQTGNIIHLYIDKTRAGKISDTRYLLSDIALGCVAENMLIQGRHLGFEGKVQYFPNDEATSPLFPLSITFKKAETTESISANAIYARKTDRSFPWKGPVDKDAKQRIQAETFGIDGVNLHWLNKKQRKIACKALFLAESLRFSNKKFHQELFSSIDFNLNWKQSSTEHLAPAALNIEFFAKPIFKAARNWKTMKIL